jgi:hypothetical protein
MDCRPTVLPPTGDLNYFYRESQDSGRARIYESIPFRHRHTLRFSVSQCNPTNHFKPLDVHANLSDPSKGMLFVNYVPGSGAIFGVLF